MTDNQLRSIVERIERIQAEIDELNADKRDLYAEAKGNGYDVKALKAVVAARKKDAAERDEQEALFDLYWNAVHGTGTIDATRVRPHEIAPTFEAAQ